MPKHKQGHGIVLDEKGQEQPADKDRAQKAAKPSRATCRPSPRKTNFNRSRKRADFSLAGRSSQSATHYGRLRFFCGVGPMENSLMAASRNSVYRQTGTELEVLLGVSGETRTRGLVDSKSRNG